MFLGPTYKKVCFWVLPIGKCVSGSYLLENMFLGPTYRKVCFLVLPVGKYVSWSYL